MLLNGKCKLIGVYFCKRKKYLNKKHNQIFPLNLPQIDQHEYRYSMLSHLWW